MSMIPRLLALVLAAGAFCVSLLVEWHPSFPIRAATAIVLAAMILWISELAPLGVVGLLIPIAASATDLLTWRAALESWGDPIIFQFLGAFLLARALEKHGAFDGLAASAQRNLGSGPVRTAAVVVLLAGALSAVQNNTAVAAMLLPVVLIVARRTHRPAVPLLALAYGATFGGMATAVGTAPNFIGYAAIQGHDAGFGFLSWMRVGVPVWLGISVIGAAALWISARIFHRSEEEVSGTDALQSEAALLRARSLPVQVVVRDPTGAEPDRTTAGLGSGLRSGKTLAIGLFVATALIWIGQGALVSGLPSDSPWLLWLRKYLPEAMIPLGAAIVGFFIRPRGDRPLLDRRDFQSIDWDTLFLIAGGLCLGRVLESSGAARELAEAVAHLSLPSWATMLMLAGVTVLLSELTTNTATAGLMVPIAASLAEVMGLSKTACIMLVALSASLGFALPVSTPPNAIVYGTRMIPLRQMIVTGLLVDAAAVVWVVICVRWLG